MTATHGCPLPAPWAKALWRRLCVLPLLKIAGTTLGIAAFFVVYFWVMHNPLARPVTIPLTPVDRWIVASELALLPYASLWLYVSLAPALSDGSSELLAYAKGAAIISVTGFVIYWFFPTAVPEFPTDWSRYPALEFLKSADASGNAFPSLHVAFAAYTGAVIARQLRSVGAPSWLRWTNRIWLVAIVYSTLATRQHVLVDVIGGLLLAGFAICLSVLRERYPPPRQSSV
ncbi:MAG: phosphatase PAP2 family protein [Burkholderiaceae bacterium]